MIREAETSDARAIAGMWNWMIRDTNATFTTEEKPVPAIEALVAERPGRFFVAEDQATLRGFVTFGPFRSGPGYAATCEHSVIIDPKAHRGGLGRALMMRAQEAASAAGLRIMVAAISGANPQAVAFHRALGFAKVGHMPQVGRKGGQLLDLILMQKNLS